MLFSDLLKNYLFLRHISWENIWGLGMYLYWGVFTDHVGGPRFDLQNHKTNKQKIKNLAGCNGTGL
jgi:hypothetical protein